MNIKLLFRLVIIISIISPSLAGQNYETLTGNESLKKINSESGITKPVTLTVLYDNYVTQKGTEADWGFSVLIDGLEKRVLFDAGTNPEILRANIEATKSDIKSVDLLVLSHEHGDHTQGIPAVSDLIKGKPVIIPHSFSGQFRKKMESAGLKPILVAGPAEICDDLYTSGQFDFLIPEEALVLDTKNGLVVITGCAHPGITEMLGKVKNNFGKNIYMVMGGFHLMNKTDGEMNEIISEMKKLGVVKCGATHCTGEKQIKMFRDAFGKDYFELGTGNRIIIN